MEATNTASLLFNVGKIIRARVEHVLPISFTQAEALRLLGDKKSLTMRAIAAHFKIAAPSATAIVNELVRAEYVTRTENTKDRREVMLSLTTKGKAMLRSVSGNRKKIISEVLAVLSPHDRKQLDMILNKILINTETRQL